MISVKRAYIILYFILVFFTIHCESKFSSFINVNDGKSNVTFISMSKINETRLVSNSILVNMSASHQSLCTDRCVKTKNCTSYNIFKDNQNVFQCQLLSENKYLNSKQLEKKVGWAHASIQSIPCERSPCKNNATCIPMYSENNFLCNCSADYLGSFCETELHKMITLPLQNLGCWRDTINSSVTILEGSSILLDGLYKNREYAIEKCFKAANLKGFLIFAVQDGGSCSASNNNSYEIYGLSNGCKHDGKGGLLAIQVYKIMKKISFSYAGCWADSKPRALPSLEGISSLLDGRYKDRSDVIKKCFFSACERSYEFFAIQDGGQCYVGNGDSYKKYGIASNCHVDGTGGNMVSAVYIIGFA